MNLDKIEKLVKIIENSSMLDFSIQEGDVKIKMSRRGSVGAPAAPMSVSTQGVDTVEVLIPKMNHTSHLDRRYLLFGSIPRCQGICEGWRQSQGRTDCMYP